MNKMARARAEEVRALWSKDSRIRKRSARVAQKRNVRFWGRRARGRKYVRGPKRIKPVRIALLLICCIIVKLHLFDLLGICCTTKSYKKSKTNPQQIEAIEFGFRLAVDLL